MAKAKAAKTKPPKKAVRPQRPVPRPSRPLSLARLAALLCTPGRSWLASASRSRWESP